MGVFVTMYLFGKPGQELDEGEELMPHQLRDLAAKLNARLTEAADVVEKLTDKGWEAQMGLYDVFLSHPYMNTTTQVEAQFHDLGIDPERVFIDQIDDEDELTLEEELCDADDLDEDDEFHTELDEEAGKED